MQKNNEKALESLEFQGYRRLAGMGFEPHDLRVMSPTSYQAALPRDLIFDPFLALLKRFW